MERAAALFLTAMTCPSIVIQNLLNSYIAGDGLRGIAMALVKLRRFAQLTLPAEVRKQFQLTEGDYLEVHSTKSGILLKPVSMVERAAAWKEVGKILTQVHAQHSASKRSAREEEEWIAQEVKAHRKAKRSAKHAGSCSQIVDSGG